MLSDNKINVLTNKVLHELISNKLIILKVDEVVVRKEIKNTILDGLKKVERIDNIVRNKISSLSRKVVEGSIEWDILYKKLFEEEEQKQGKRQ